MRQICVFDCTSCIIIVFRKFTRFLGYEGIIVAVMHKKKPLKKFDKLGDDTPVLPSLASTMDVELVASPEAEVMVIMTSDAPEEYWWAEYDVDLQQLYFITVNAKIQGLGMKIHEPFEKNMLEATKVRLVKYNPTTKKMHGLPNIVPLVVRKHTLEDVGHG